MTKVEFMKEVVEPTLEQDFLDVIDGGRKELREVSKHDEDLATLLYDVVESMQKVRDYCIKKYNT